MYLKSKNKYECSGCTACYNICPHKAISMIADDEGFFFPEINIDLCVACGMCEEVCPMTIPFFNQNVIPEIYAAYINDQNEREHSSSGALFYAIATWIIQEHGIVYGAAFDSALRLYHIGVESIEELNNLRGSKYLQSYLGDVFKEIKQHLIKGRWVYFTGTGCQVAGLKSYLRKDYEKLITSDLVCHGTPSQKLFDWHMDYLGEKYHGQLVSYKFRDDKLWSGCEIAEIKNNNNKLIKIYRPTYYLSPYLYSFMHGYTYRYSCYKCPFSTVPRQGDITLGDFWGVKKFFQSIDINGGVSLVIINSQKGTLIWDKIKQHCNYYKSNLNDAAKYNNNIIHYTDEPIERKNIYTRINNEGYKSVIQGKEFRAPNYNFLYLKSILMRTKLYKLMKLIIYNK